jgi:hypothetical protein
MPALTADRTTRRREGDRRTGLVVANVRIFAGAILMRNATGHLTRGATATGACGVGVATEACDNTGGAAGAKSVAWRVGVFVFANSAAADAITIADIGRACFIVDDNTVAQTDGGATRSRAGIVEDVDASGVWVRFDEGLTRAA